MRAEDVAEVREAIVHAYDDPQLEGIVSYRALAALDRLEARLQEAERERDEFRHEAEAQQGRFFEALARAYAAEAREAALRSPTQEKVARCPRCGERLALPEAEA
jgi:hypothetical protein